MSHNKHPFTEAGVMARLEETQRGHQAFHFATQFGVEPVEMRKMLVTLVKAGKIKSFSGQDHTQYCSLNARQYDPPVPTVPEPFYLRPPMTAASARRAGTFWTLAEAIRR